MIVKFIYSEKATKFCEIFPLLLTTVHTVKSKGKISQNFVAFSEYMNFKSLSEALILAATDPHYVKLLFIELRVHYMKIPTSEHVENMCLDKKIQNNHGIWKCEKNLRQIFLCALYLCVQMFIVTNNLFLYLVSKLVLLKQQNSEDGRIS